MKSQTERSGGRRLIGLAAFVLASMGAAGCSGEAAQDNDSDLQETIAQLEKKAPQGKRPIVESHIHFWPVTRPGGVPWPTPAEGPIYRDVLPDNYTSMAKANVDDYDALVLPGGVANPDRLRTDEDAVAFVRDFVASGKPVAAICHAPWTLIEAGAVAGKTLTSWPSLRTDLINAGASWVDEQVHVDSSAGWTLVTSRKPDDLPAFCHEAVRAFAS